MRYRTRFDRSPVVHTSSLRVGPRFVGTFAYLPLDCGAPGAWTDVVVVEAGTLVTCLGCVGRRG